jgi:hypothetical protein
MVKDNFKIFQYVIKLIRFLADLCEQGNQSAIDALRPIYRLETCIEIITNPVLSKDLRGSFMKLVSKLWTTGSATYQNYQKRLYCKI